MIVGVVIPTVAKKSQLNVFVPRLLKSLSVAWLAQPKSQHRASCTVILYVNGLKPFSALIPKLERQLQHQVDSSLKVKIIANLGNRGFTGSVNDALQYVLNTMKLNWIAVLNDDTEVAPTFWQTLLPWARHHHCDVVSCPVLKPNGELESFGLQYHRSGLAFPYTPQQIESGVVSGSSGTLSQSWLVCGTGFVVSQRAVKQAFSQFGYFFNPLFFAYAEDVELSLRWQLLGVQYGFCADTSLIHFGSQTSSRGSEFQLYHGFRNLCLVMILMWRPAEWAARFPFIILGQMYALALSWYKGYWLLAPKIAKYMWVHRLALRTMREEYAQKLVSSHSI